jgi:hypothetical protein
MLRNPGKKSPQAVDNFIKSQSVIRVSADNSPGSGNQAASGNVVTRVREIGFQGIFEFIYANLTSAKIATLFSLPIPIPDVYFDAESAIRFIKFQEHVRRLKTKSLEVIPLGITGADDQGLCQLASIDGVEVNDLSKLECMNSANFLGVQVHIELSPYYVSKTSFIQRNNPNRIPYSQVNSVNKFFVMPVTNYIDALQYLHDDAHGQKILLRKPGLQSIIDIIAKQTANLMPVYGWPIQRQYYDGSYHKIFGSHLGHVLQIIAGARHAQLNGPEGYEKPLILMVFYDYMAEATEILKIINSDHWDIYEMDGANAARTIIVELTLRDNFFIADAADNHTPAVIDALKPNQVLLLSLGQLPKNIFDALYTHTAENIWSPIREGASSLNSLILTGRPHIRCSPDWELGYDRVQDASLKQELAGFYQYYQYQNRFGESYGFCWGGIKAWDANPNIYLQLSHLLIQANNVTSPLSRYFTFLKQEALKPENDRILFGIQGALELLPPLEKVTQMKQTDSVTVFAESKITEFDLLTVPGKTDRVLFDYGTWDDEIKNDPLTSEPIFTFRLYQKQKEVGSAEFYGQPFLCSSEDGRQHNIVKTTGILQEFKLTNEMKIEEVCRVLPPSLFDKVLASVGGAAAHGFLRGTSKVVGFTLQSRGFSRNVANYLSQLTYYGSVFAMKFISYSQQIQEYESASAYCNAMYRAAMDTGQLWLTNVALGAISRLMVKSGYALERKGWSLLGKGFTKAAPWLGYSIFASNALRNSPVEITTAIVTGSIVETGTVSHMTSFIKKHTKK